MTLAQAVEILNRERHQSLEWEAVQGDASGYNAGRLDTIFTAFEAIAIAERYERLARQGGEKQA